MENLSGGVKENADIPELPEIRRQIILFQKLLVSYYRILGGMNLNLLKYFTIAQIMETRFYGAALLGLASLCIIVTFGNWRNRRAIRIVLLVVSFFLAAEFLGNVFNSLFPPVRPFQQSIIVLSSLIASCCSYHSIGDSNSLMENLIGRASWSNSMQMIIFLISMYYYVQTAAPSSESLRSKRTD